MLLRGGCRLRCLVLIFFCIQLQSEETGQIASSAAATSTATALLSEGDLNLPEGRLSTQQPLKRLLFQWNGIFPLHALQPICRRSHCLGCGLHVFVEAGKLFVRGREITALDASREREHLVAQLLLCIGEELSCHSGVFRSCDLVILLLPGRSDQLLLAFRDFGLVVLSPPTSTTPAAALLRLRKLALKRVGLNETDLCTRLSVSVLRCCVEAH